MDHADCSYQTIRWRELNSSECQRWPASSMSVSALILAHGQILQELMHIKPLMNNLLNAC